jgi:hypothetical protein
LGELAKQARKESKLNNSKSWFNNRL